MCAAVSQRERCVKHVSLCQHQSVGEDEEAHVRHVLVDSNDAWTHTDARYDVILQFAFRLKERLWIE